MTRQQYILQRGADILNTAIRRESLMQGHYLTGALQKSIRATASGKNGLNGTAAGYGIYVNEGVTADRIPFSGRTGRGGTSKYIEALTRYWMLRGGLSQKEALRAAFATAHKHKRQGMGYAPSPYSRTGRSRKMVEDAFERSGKRAKDAILQGFRETIGNELKKTRSGII